MLITQNIDDLHAREIKGSAVLSRQTQDPFCTNLTNQNRVAFTPHVYEIHGNVYYMHCSDETMPCSRDFFETPSLQTFEE